MEVLQFLTNSGKTGTLRVYDDSDVKLLAFERGQLLYAIHKRKLPPLTELLVHRGLLSEEDAANHPATDMRWDELVSRVLERHRKELKRNQVESVVRPPTVNRLGPVLLTQGRISQSQLDAAMDPETIPDKCLKKVLKDAGVIHTIELLNSWTGVREGRSLYTAIVEKKILSADDIRDAVRYISDESLAEILVYQGALTRAEARLCLDQLDSLKECAFPNIRLGEYMVAKRQITQRQLEKALGEQLSSSALLGTILVAQGAITREDLERSNWEIDAIRSDFGPMHAFRFALEESHGIDSAEFARALRAHRESGRVMVQTIGESGRVSVAAQRELIESVLIGELCDLLIWPEAAFEFYEGFSVKDTLANDEPWCPDDEPFDMQPILLNACRDLDEMQNLGMRDIFLDQVFVRKQNNSNAPDLSVKDNILRRIDGRRSLRQAARVLPGNRLSHFKLFVELLSAGEIEALSRRAAYEIGAKCLERNHYAEALVLFHHALATEGERPSNYKLRRAIQDARLASEKRFLWRAALRVKQFLSPLDARQATQRPWSKKGQIAGNWLRSRTVRLRESIRHTLVRGRLGFENFLMRRGWARNLWALKVYLSRPLEKMLGRGTARAAVVIGASAAALLIGMTQALPDDIPDFRMDLPGREDRPTQLRSTMALHVVDAPLETAPTIDGQQIYLAARDGELRALELEPGSADERTGPELALRWSVQVGEYGDILSRPVHADQSIFLTNVRGFAYAISPDGEIRWQRKLTRLEPMPPTPLYSSGSELVGVAVVSRESVYVLDPEGGEVLHRLQTGNRIFARPVGDDEVLVVGSGDSHIYMVRWREDQVVWEHEVSDDITGLIVHDGAPVFATRDGRLAALNPSTGEELWQRTFPRNAIKSLVVLQAGEVYIEIGRGTIEVIDPRNGHTVSSFSADPTLGVSSASMFDHRYYYFSNSGFMGELNAAGRARWRTKAPVGDITGWDHGNDFMAVTNRNGELLVFFRRSKVLHEW